MIFLIPNTRPIWRERTKRKMNNIIFITLMDGKQIEYHPSFNFHSEIYSKMNQADRDQMKR